MRRNNCQLNQEVGVNLLTTHKASEQLEKPSRINQ
jgi:hypothetical protein